MVNESKPLNQRPSVSTSTGDNSTRQMNSMTQRFHSSSLRSSFTSMSTTLIAVAFLAVMLVCDQHEPPNCFVQGFSSSKMMLNPHRQLAPMTSSCTFRSVARGSTSTVMGHVGYNPFSSMLKAANVDSSSAGKSKYNVKILGRGADAVVKLGSILVPPSEEFHHYYRESAIYIYAMGTTDDDDSGDYVIRGVLIDHPTPFVLDEVIENDGMQMEDPLGFNLIYRGGGNSKESILLFHKHSDLDSETSTQIADNIYQGGLNEGRNKILNGNAESTDFKFFFGYCEFTEEELEEMLNSSFEDENDTWTSVTVDNPDFILSTDWEKGDAYKYLRNSIKQQLDNSNNKGNINSSSKKKQSRGGGLPPPRP